jgi:hypothetical protein
MGDRPLLGVQPAPGDHGLCNERGDEHNMARTEVATGRLQCDANQGTGVLRGKILDLNEQHAEHIDIALELAKGAATDITMLRIEIDWDRANLLQLTHAYRDALKDVLTGKIVRLVNKNGHSFPVCDFERHPIRPSVVALIQEICRELDLGAEHAG